MNYHSTRNAQELSPAEDILFCSKAGDGGLYVPEKMPRRLSDGDMASLAWLSHGRRLAHLTGMLGCGLNFDETISSLEPVFAKEKYGINTTPITVRDGLCYLDLTRGPGGNPDDFTIPVLSALNNSADGCKGSWTEFLCHVTVWISAYCEMILRRHIRFPEPVDVCVTASGYDYLAAAVFARAMGVPIIRITYISANCALAKLAGDEGCVMENADIEPGLERILYELSGRDCGVVAQIVSDAASGKEIKLPGGLRQALRDGIRFMGSIKDVSENSEAKLLILEDK